MIFRKIKMEPVVLLCRIADLIVGHFKSVSNELILKTIKQYQSFSQNGLKFLYHVAQNHQNQTIIDYLHQTTMKIKNLIEPKKVYFDLNKNQIYTYQKACIFCRVNQANVIVYPCRCQFSCQYCYQEREHCLKCYQNVMIHVVDLD